MVYVSSCAKSSLNFTDFTFTSQTLLKSCKSNQDQITYFVIESRKFCSGFAYFCLVSAVDGISLLSFYCQFTGKSLSEALIFVSTNPYMTTDCSLNYEFSTWKFQAQNMLCTQIVVCFDIQDNLFMFLAWNLHVLNL